MVALLALRLGLPLDFGDGALASLLMAGIVMDTATFAHPNATPRTLAVSAALVHAGAPLSDISRRLYRSKPEAQLRLFGRVLDRLESSDDGRIVWSTLLDADLDATGTRPPHSEGIIDLLAQADDAEVSILFKEAGDGTRISVRTKPGGVDATVLTGRFGGGGHARAAGATVGLPVDQARPAVLAEATRLVADVAR
jgi:phosphoesterase RecJ-like protein